MESVSLASEGRAVLLTVMSKRASQPLDLKLKAHASSTARIIHREQLNLVSTTFQPPLVSRRTDVTHGQLISKPITNLKFQ
jgi:hypothetical protein